MFIGVRPVKAGETESEIESGPWVTAVNPLVVFC